MIIDNLTKTFLEQKLTEYYSNCKLFTPREIERREWAFVSVNALPNFLMNRHLSFSNEIELKGYLIKNPPLHAFFSSAYYEKPDADKMDEKGWLKADLIFDIDADHIPKGSLEKAKKQVIRLYDILEEDFGCKDMQIVFSGSRGYHIHVYDEEFLSLDSRERKELVDYFQLKSLSFNKSLPRTPQYMRISECMAKSLENLVKKGKAEKFFNIRKKTAEKLKEIISRKRDEIYSGKFSSLPRSVIKKLPNLFSKCVEFRRIYIDPPVTSDVKRLIRLPNSIHGKSSLRVTPISRDEIEAFDPQKDAIAFGDEKVRVRVMKKVKFKLKDTEFRLEKGYHTLPEYVAMYLICKLVAMYGW